jgi:hypothetical protein
MNETTPNRTSRWVMTVAMLIGITCLCASLGRAQTFNSGSTGSDGVFAPSVNTVLTVPPTGVFNFTTITIPTGVTVTFTPNATNTPVTMLATGDVSIAGVISLDGAPALTPSSGGVPGNGGPGGFRGGNGHGTPNVSGGTGIGPGGGLGLVSGGNGGSYATNGGGATNLTYGAPELLPLIGGSGGGGSGGGTTSGHLGTGGGGGGGAILIASSTAITIQSGGKISASGGVGSSGGGVSGSGGGSGGAIRLIANLVKVAGTSGVALQASGGSAISTSPGGVGRIRLEAFTITLSGSQVIPAASTGLPTIVGLLNPPTLSITSIGGVGVPSNPTGAGGGLDITLPNQSGPTDIDLAASGIPLGTTINVSIKPETGDPVNATSTPLSGTVSNSTATATATMPTGSSIISASVTLSASAGLAVPFMYGGEPVKNVRVASVLGGKSSVFLITESGKEISWE